jgi:hypothetical protein
MYCKNSALSVRSHYNKQLEKNVLISYSFCYREWLLTAKMSMSKVGILLQIPLGKNLYKIQYVMLILYWEQCKEIH